MTRYIVFTGPSLSGKTTSATLLVSLIREHGYTTVLESFEYPMKQYLDTLFAQKISIRPMDEPIYELLYKTPRTFIQLQSQHMRFAYGPGVLGRLLASRIKRYTQPPEYVIVDDGTNITDLRELGQYVLVRMDRDRIERVYPFAIPDPDYSIMNSKGVPWLKQQIEKLAISLTEKH
jgi:hypothetical protein